MKSRDSTPSHSQPGFAGTISRTLRRSISWATVVFLVLLCISTFARTSDTMVELEMRATTGDTGEIFYAAPGESASGARTVRFQIEPGYGRYRLWLPDEALGMLRLDPGTDPGSVSIRRMTVREGAKELKFIDGPRLARLTAMHAIHREASAPGDAVQFTATEADPYIVFEVPPGFSGVRPWQRALGWGLLSAVIFALTETLARARLRQRPDLAHRLQTTQAEFRRRFKHPVWRWLSLALAPLAGLLWAGGQDLPIRMCIGLCLALVSTAAAGLAAQSWIEGFRARSEDTRRPGLFQLLWLGQYLIFAFAMLITPFAGLLADLTGIHVPLRISLPVLLVVFLLVTLRVARARKVALALPTAASGPPTALALLAVFRAMYLHSIHAGALGHDTQQHVYWTQHIADYGFLPLTARGSDLLDAYPKFFHLLAAAWSALGSSATVGPYVKLMPALQVTFACAFLCELVPSLLSRRETGPQRDRSLMRTTLGAFIAWHMTLGDGQQIYDGNDLSGTPRLAAAWVLLGLPLLFLAHHARTLRGAGPWILGLVPVLAVLGLGVNPVLVPLYLTYSLPVTIILALLTRDRARCRVQARWLRHLAAGAAVSIPLILANPFVVSELSNTRLGATVISSAGVRTTAAGIPDPPIERPQLCGVPLADCVVAMAKDVVVDGGRRFVDSVVSADMPALRGGAHSAMYWLMFAAPLFVAAFRRVTHPAASSQASRDGARLFLAILVASAFPAMVYPVVLSLFGKLANQDSNFLFLSAYFGSLRMFLGAWLRCLLPLSSWLLLPTFVAGGGPRLVSWLILAFVGILGLNSFQIGSLAAHRNASGPWAIDWSELDAIGHLNDFVPAHETVVLPAQHVLANERENLLMTLDPVAAVGTELKTRMLFMVRLGTSRDFGWQELKKRFCAAPEERQSLLRSVNARWVLVRAENPRSITQLDADLWNCGVTLRTLEAEYPPAWTERDLALYRISP